LIQSIAGSARHFVLSEDRTFRWDGYNINFQKEILMNVEKAIIPETSAPIPFQERSNLNIGAAQGDAIREFQTNTGPVDYALRNL
jgi:hypothetical protein